MKFRKSIISKISGNLNKDGFLYRLLYNLFIIVVIVLLARLSFHLTFGQDILFPVYLPAGVTFYFLYNKPKTNLWGIFIGIFIEAFHTLMPLYGELGFVAFLANITVAFANTLQPFYGNYLLKAHTNYEVIFKDSNDLAKSIGLIFISCVVSGILGGLALSWISFFSWKKYLYSISNWAISDVAAILTITPFLIMLEKKRTFSISPEDLRLVEKISFFIATGFFQLIVLIGTPQVNSLYKLDFLVIIFMIWAGFRFSIPVSLLHIISVSFSMILGALLGHFPDNLDLNNALFYSQIFMLVISIANLFLLTLINERRNRAKNLEKEVENAISKLNTLKGFLPICASCKKIRDNEGNWQNMEEYIHSHSEAKFSHGYCPECAEKFVASFKKEKE